MPISVLDVCLQNQILRMTVPAKGITVVETNVIGKVVTYICREMRSLAPLGISMLDRINSSGKSCHPLVLKYGQY